MTSRDVFHVPTEVNNIVLFYPSTTQAMVDSQCEIIWANTSGAGLGRHPTADYVAAADVLTKKEIIYQ